MPVHGKIDYLEYPAHDLAATKQFLFSRNGTRQSFAGGKNVVGFARIPLLPIREKLQEFWRIPLR